MHRKGQTDERKQDTKNRRAHDEGETNTQRGQKRILQFLSMMIPAPFERSPRGGDSTGQFVDE